MCIALGKAAGMHCKLGGTPSIDPRKARFSFRDRASIANCVLNRTSSTHATILHSIFNKPIEESVARRSAFRLAMWTGSDLLCRQLVKGIILMALMLILWVIGGLMGTLTVGWGMLPFEIMDGRYGSSAWSTCMPAAAESIGRGSGLTLREGDSLNELQIQLTASS
jgi:hypothetical protein